MSTLTDAPRRPTAPAEVVRRWPRPQLPRWAPVAGRRWSRPASAPWLGLLLGWRRRWRSSSAASALHGRPAALVRRVEGRRAASTGSSPPWSRAAFGLALLPLVSLLWTVIPTGLGLNADFLTYSMRNVVGEGGGIYHAIFGT